MKVLSCECLRWAAQCKYGDNNGHSNKARQSLSHSKPKIFDQFLPLRPTQILRMSSKHSRSVMNVRSRQCQRRSSCRSGTAVASTHRSGCRVGGSFFPIQRRRVESKIGKSPICAEHIINHPLYQAVCKRFQTTKSWYWSGEKKVFATSDPQLNNSICFSIGSGAWENLCTGTVGAIGRTCQKWQCIQSTLIMESALVGLLLARPR